MKILLWMIVLTLLYIHIAPQVEKYYGTKGFAADYGCQVGSHFIWSSLTFMFWVPNCKFNHNY